VLQEDPVSLAVLPPDVLVGVLRQLPLSVRLRECSLVCRTWRAAAAVATDDLLVVPPTGSCNAAAFQSWMVQHGSNLKALELNYATIYQQQGVQLPFQQLHSLTKLWATNTDLLNWPSAVDPAGTTGSSSTTSTSSGNPLTALTSLAELGLSCSRVLAVPGALQYLPAFGASLTRLQLEHVDPKYVSKGSKAEARILLWMCASLLPICCCCNCQEELYAVWLGLYLC
jgi:hypothetical protein